MWKETTSSVGDTISTAEDIQYFGGKFSTFRHVK